MEEDPKIHRERYRVFMEDIADGFYETDLQGDFKFFNNGFCRILGCSRDEIQEHSYREFMDEKNVKITFEKFNHIYRTGKGVTCTKLEVTRKDGEVRILEISADPIIDDNGQKTGFRGIVRDISEQHRARQIHLESEQRIQKQYQASRSAEFRYRAFLDFLPDPLFAFNLDSTVSYLNPAFVKVFGWTSEELAGRRIPFVPDFLKEEARWRTKLLFKEKVVHGVETKRLTRDGRMLDVLVDGAIFYDEENEPTGQFLIIRDITQEKRIARINETLFSIAKALHRYRRLDENLEFIIKEVRDLIAVDGASVILLDEEKKEFFFRAATYDDTETGKKFKEIRFPVDKGNAGYVYRTGKPLIVPDTSKNPFFLKKVDQQTGYETRNMLFVPIWVRNRMIGVLCAVNKKDGDFSQADVELLTTIANTVALPIENAGINEALKRSYEEVKSINRAKDRVIHHLSHELKTPLSVLIGSLGLISKKLSDYNDQGLKRILDRAQRNLNRILEMQYKIEDILRERDYKTYHMLSVLFEACADQLEVMVSEELGEENAVQKIRSRIEETFGPRESLAQEIHLDYFVEEKIQSLRPGFAHRQCQLKTQIQSTPPVWIPDDVLTKIIEGLIRNAVENTPDGGRIEVMVRDQNQGPEFEVKDFGVGITEENQRLIFESNFTANETMQYSSRKPYDFNAGGKGFDLLRMKIFSERYEFTISMTSNRCRFILGDEDFCPGNIMVCDHCRTPEDCVNSGGTTMTVRFLPADRFFSNKQ